MNLSLERYARDCIFSGRAELERIAGSILPQKEAPLYKWPHITLKIIIGTVKSDKPINFYDLEHIIALEEEAGGTLHCSTIHSGRGGLVLTHGVSEILKTYELISQKDMYFCPYHPEFMILWETKA
jgi:hypothetical protein